MPLGNNNRPKNIKGKMLFLFPNEKGIFIPLIFYLVFNDEIIGAGRVPKADTLYL